MKKKTLAELDLELTDAIRAYINECGSVTYARRFIQIVLHNEKKLEKILRTVK